MSNLPDTFQNFLMALSFVRRHGISGFKIFTHLTWQERLILYRSVRLLAAPRILVEIGSYLGASAYFLAAAASETGQDTKVFCVDTWENYGMSEGYRDTWNEFSENVSRFSDLIIPKRGLSAEVGRAFTDEIDLLFVDGDHSAEGCKADSDSWIPHVRKGGIVLFHDYGWAEGVQKAVFDLTSRSILTDGKAYRNMYRAYKA
jgi:predicted O-methyltransferase YrrM